MVNPSPRQKKWIKWILILLAIRFIMGAVLYYAITYRFKDIAAFIVEKESKGTYAFNADHIGFSLSKKNMVLKNVTLVCKDTSNVASHYDIKIPEAYFSIASWTDLIFHKKLVIDSLAVTAPTLKVHEHKIREQKHVAFHISSILTNLKRTLVHFQIRSLHLKEGAFSYTRKNGPAPLQASHLNLSIRNFTRITNSDSHLLASDDIDISLHDQNWVLPDGNHTISFKKLHFSGKNQRFELDSCVIHGMATAEKGAMSLSADRFVFNSKHLPAIYMKDELLIDTLLCIHPVLKLPRSHKPQQVKDTATIAGAAHQLFKKINIQYIDVQEGELLLKNHDTTAAMASAQKNNLKIFNLNIHPAANPPITTDSIQFNLKEIRFYSPDSLFQIAIDEFTLLRNDIIFTNAVYGPSPYNHTGKGLTFTAPFLRLNNIDIADLIQKKLHAASAVLYEPAINFYDHRKTEKTIARQTIFSDTTHHEAGIYQTLHGLSELVNVKDFHIVNGQLNFQSSRGKAVRLQVQGMHADILLNHFFQSDSLVDIKHSIPKLQIKTVQLRTAGMELQADNYRFNGIQRNNHLDQLQLHLANGTVIKGEKLYWEVFDWDVYQQTKNIQINLLHFNHLSIDLNNNKKAATSPAQKLPVIRIGELAIQHLAFNMGNANSHLQFNAHEIFLDNIYSTAHHFVWKHAVASLYNLSFDHPGIKVAIPRITFNNLGESVMDAARISLRKDKADTRIFIPSIKITGNLHSTDPEQLFIQSFSATQATVNHQTVGTTDTTTLDATVSAQIKELHKKGEGFAYHSATAHLSDISLHTAHLTAFIPQSSLTLTNGHITPDKKRGLSLTASTRLTWNQATVKLQQTDSTKLTQEALSGVFEDPAASFHPKTKFAWPSLVNKTTLHAGRLVYKGKQVTAHAGSYNWDPAGNTFSVYNFDVTPNKSREETFRTQKWQGDYMVVRGGAAHISGITFPQLPADSGVKIKKVILDKADLITARDKRMPFQHGIEKPMPTKLINTIPLALQIDTIHIQQSKVTVQESSKATNKWSSIPIEHINGVITHIKSRHNANDSLTVTASGKLFNNHIRHFSYRESYGDSLSAFHAQSNLSPVFLTDFSQIAMPMAAVRVNSGYADTVFATWSGNKYATLGTMDFYYKNLSIGLMSKKDSTRQRWFLSLLANTFLRNANNKQSLLFVARDREKFIFNYWVKAQTKGLLTSVGVKRNKKYLRQYRKIAARYSLPAR